ncbi:amidohydrolase [Erythrobacteraceae bacterium CFH 75059]|uniref:amidohydrolase family protein n=1 Tax=Qipengyuania thermophila TaxID=2509361 RepID=UPI001022529D|nr:amidohydrolase family protein [Qipengyuania thermophila]TCD05106.1 amidohydrolase [Erythrobacteraceae bacterium CFH 75059]
MASAARPAEEALEPDWRIVDPHHHLWDLRPLLPIFPEPRHPFVATVARTPRYGFDELMGDLAAGHRVTATVFIECGAFYNPAYGPRQSFGELEYVTGVAAQGAAAGAHGEVRPCAAIVGHLDLRMDKGELDAALADAAVRFPRLRGLRHQGAWHADPDVLGPPFHAPPGLYASDAFRRGAALLSAHALTFDAWVLEPQLEDVLDLARALPDLPICLDHCGTPLNIAAEAGRLAERFGVWRDKITALAACENVVVKLGGLGMPFCGMPATGDDPRPSSAQLADLWRPYIETCIEAFGPRRAMFESNYPVDRWAGDYVTIWNAFKRIAAGASAEERDALFAGTAERFYRLADPDAG